MTRIKKYGNRRLYDTSSSSYITLDKLAEKIRGGEQVQVVDAKSGEDLTQVTLAQMVLEGPSAKLLPAALLHQLIRLQDDDFAEFFGRYVTWALDVYLLARAGGSAAASGFPFPMGPFA
ncbi:MAG: polyhydroxyalkanoate synthesis regulator DNA-binding domain-containing protein, partial [Myxococcota bacterium]